MALVNHAKKEINAKIVYYGSAGSGKSTALRYIFSRIKPSLRGELKNVPAGDDNLQFFDFSPFDGPLRDDYRVRLHVYTLTGRVTNPATWKMTLKGADGLIIMVDASADSISNAKASIFQLREFLSAYGAGLHATPAVLQLNRFELKQTDISGEQLATALDLVDLPCCFSNTANGEGVLEALAILSRLVLDRVSEKDFRRNEYIEDPVAENSKDILELSEDTSVNWERNSTSAFAAQTSQKAIPEISLKYQLANQEGSILKIPLEIACGGTSSRVVVTISIGTE